MITPSGLAFPLLRAAGGKRRGTRAAAMAARYPLGPCPFGQRCPDLGPGGLASGQLDLDVDASGQFELHQSIDSGRGRLDDIQQTLVGAHLELLARLLVDMRAAVHGELLDARRQRNGATNESAGAAGGVGDVAGRLVEDAVIKCLEANTDILRFHYHFTDAKERKTNRPRNPLIPGGTERRGG